MTNRAMNQIDQTGYGNDAVETQFSNAAITRTEDNKVQLREQISRGLKTFRLTKDGQNSLVIDRTSEGMGLERDRRPKSTDGSSHSVSTEQLRQATAQILETAVTKYGKERVERLHIAPDDIGSSVAVLALTPDVCQILGPDKTRQFGRRLFVFGVAPAFGAAEKAQHEQQNQPVAFALKFAKDFSEGALLNTPLEATNPAFIILPLASFVNEQLHSPEHKERNSHLQEINTQIENASNEELVDLAIRSKHLLAADEYKTVFDIVTDHIERFY
ncbi:MAG TPA: hypothetical protein V6C97_19035 [Oculatellaceae cyanobacterium]